MRKPDPVTDVVKLTSSGGFSQDDDIPIVVTERRLGGKSRLRLPVDDDESDGAQALPYLYAPLSFFFYRNYDAMLSNEINVQADAVPFLTFFFALRVAVNFLLFSIQMQ